MNDFDKRMREKAKEAIKSYLTERSKPMSVELTRSSDQGIRFDYTKHGIGARVVELKSGRRGEVVDLRETSYEVIEPFIRWDSENEISRASGVLLLEDSV